MLQQYRGFIYKEIQVQDLALKSIQDTVWVEKKVGQGSFG